MKKTKLKNVLKTTGLIAGLSLTLASCGNGRGKQLSDQERQLIVNRVDSILDKDDQYRLSQTMLDFSVNEIDRLRASNRAMAINCAKQYIKNNIQDAKLRAFMLQTLQGNNSFYYTTDSIQDSENTDEISLASVRKNNRWFNDLIMYLHNNYTDEQFLNSEFFNAMGNDIAFRKFTDNTKRIGFMETIVEGASKRGTDIYGKTWEKCVSEYKQQKQR